MGPRRRARPRGASRAGRPGLAPPRTGSVVSVEPSPSAWAASSRFCTAGKTEASIDWGRSAGCRRTRPRAPGRRRCRPWPRGRRRAGRRGRDAAPRAPGRRPATARAVSSPIVARRRVAHDDEDEGLAVLGARRVRRRGQDAGDRLVVHVVGEERPRRPLGEHHLEEVGIGVGHGGRWYRAGVRDRPTAGGLGAVRTAPLPLALHRPAAGARHDDVVRNDGGGGQEADGGRRCRIARRGAQGDHRAADRHVQGGRGARDRCSTSPTPC